MIKCDNCLKELNRRVFCSDRCRKQYVRKADKGIIVVRKADGNVAKGDKQEIIYDDNDIDNLDG